ncbi:MAG TPA: hypothetical protein VNO20_08030 [Solirubrobacterales bacterium]|nr:hypothetical protein [Solirubrobacterales bacterium]
MTENKALALIGVGTVLLSGVVDVVLLKMHVSGELLAVGFVVVLAISAAITTRVMNHYEELAQRREREAKLTLR